MKTKTIGIFLLAPFVLSISCLMNGAAGNPQEDAYAKAVGNFIINSPEYEEKAPLANNAELVIINETNSPLEILYKVGEGINHAQLAASDRPSIEKGGTATAAQALIIPSMNNLLPLIAMLPRSMTSSWAPSFIAAALSKQVYGEDYTAYDIKRLIDGAQPPIALAFRREGLNDFKLELIKSRLARGLYDRAREDLYVNRNNLYIKNDSLNPMSVTYRAYPGIQKTVKLSSGELKVLNDMNILTDSDIHIQTETAVLPTGASSLIYGEEKTYDIPYLTLKSSEGDKPFHAEKVDVGQRYNIVIPILGDPYVEKVQ